MNIAIIGLIFSALMPIICSLTSGTYRFYTLEGGVDNKNPRAQNALLEGAGARVVAAQKNAWEALVVYVAAMLAIVISGGDVSTYALPIIIYMVSRLLHVLFYVANLDVLRSLAFFASYGSCIYMMFSVL